MERYAKRIIRNLQNQIIKGTYNPQEGLVYGLSDSPFGDIYCIYRLEKDILTCFTLFEPEVPDKAERGVLAYLEGLNKEPGGGCFYIDNILSRIIFAVDYEISKETDTPSFDSFCTLGFYRFKKDRQILYWMLTGKMAKNPDVKLRRY